MKIATVTDEVVADRSASAFPKMFDLATREGVTTFEVREIENRRFPAVQSECWDRFRKYSDEFGIELTAVSPALFKAPFSHDLTRVHRSYFLEMSLEMAAAIGVRTLITFGVRRHDSDTEDTFPRIVEMLRNTVDRAAALGFTVQLENLKGTWADTSSNCLKLLESVDHPAFGCVWDAGNYYEAGQEHFSEGYRKLKRYIRNVHLKDAVRQQEGVRWVRLGTGDMDIAGHIALLKQDGYDGTLTLETSCKPQTDENFIESARYLRGLIG